MVGGIQLPVAVFCASAAAQIFLLGPHGHYPADRQWLFPIYCIAAALCAVLLPVGAWMVDNMVKPGLSDKDQPFAVRAVLTGVINCVIVGMMITIVLFLP